MLAVMRMAGKKFFNRINDRAVRCLGGVTQESKPPDFAVLASICRPNRLGITFVFSAGMFS